MSWGPYKRYTVTMTSGSTLTSAFQIEPHKSKIYVHIPAGVTSDIYLQGACYENDTFVRIYNQQNNSVHAPGYSYVTSGTSNGLVPFIDPVEWMKLEFTTAMANTAVTFDIIACD